MSGPVTHIATADATSVTVRGRDLVNDLIGKHTFTEVFYFLVTGRMPTGAQARVLDACLVTLMEHGFTPSALIARLTAESVPDQIQVSIGAGLLAIGSVHAGTMTLNGMTTTSSAMPSAPPNRRPPPRWPTSGSSSLVPACNRWANCSPSTAPILPTANSRQAFRSINIGLADGGTACWPFCSTRRWWSNAECAGSGP